MPGPEAFVPDLGWVAFDAANGLCATDAHIRVAVGLDYLGAAPTRGARYGGGDEELGCDGAGELPVHARAEPAASRRQRCCPAERARSARRVAVPRRIPVARGTAVMVVRGVMPLARDKVPAWRRITCRTEVVARPIPADAG